MKKYLLLPILTLITITPLFSQTNKSIVDKTINWGLRIGFNSSFPTYSVEGEAGDISIDAINKVGYMSELFFRVNINKFFLQPELSLNLLKQELNIASEAHNETYKMNVYSSDMSAIIGYNTVKYDVFAFNVLLGPKIKYAYNIDSGVYTNTEDNLGIYNVYITSGVGVSVYRITFDFRYNIALLKNHMDIRRNQPTFFNSLRVYDRADILSFSFGFIF